MSEPRFQISIKHLIIATFWFGVTFTAWAWAFRIGRHQHTNFGSTEYESHAMLALAALDWSSIFPASYALIGRVKLGVIVGAGMWTFLLILSFFFLL